MTSRDLTGRFSKFKRHSIPLNVIYISSVTLLHYIRDVYHISCSTDHRGVLQHSLIPVITWVNSGAVHNSSSRCTRMQSTSHQNQLNAALVSVSATPHSTADSVQTHLEFHSQCPSWEFSRYLLVYRGVDCGVEAANGQCDAGSSTEME